MDGSHITTNASYSVCGSGLVNRSLVVALAWWSLPCLHRPARWNTRRRLHATVHVSSSAEFVVQSFAAAMSHSGVSAGAGDVTRV